MRIAKVEGRVTLSRFLPSLRGGKFLVAFPMPAGALIEGSAARGEELVVYDNLGAGFGALIGVSEGREAANPFGPDKTPVDAFCACLIDRLSFRQTGASRSGSTDHSALSGPGSGRSIRKRGAQ